MQATTCRGIGKGAGLPRIKTCQRIESVSFTNAEAVEDFCGLPADPQSETIAEVPLCAEHLQDAIVAEIDES